MVLEPPYYTRREVNSRRKASDPMTLLRIGDQTRSHTVFHQRVVKLPGFLWRCALIERSTDVESGRPDLVRMHDGTSVKELAGGIAVGVRQEQAEELRDIR
jgi:hypothetical protein